MESTATIAEWQKPRLQQMKISPNATVVDTKTNKKKKKKTTYLQKASSTQRYPTRNTLTSPLPTLK